LPLHFAAGAGHLEIVRALLDAGSDVHGAGDVHEGGVIGWAQAVVIWTSCSSCSRAGLVTISFRQ
jgi:ankyrin repeat protein